MQENQPVTFLTDGGDTVKNMAQYMAPASEHLLEEASKSGGELQIWRVLAPASASLSGSHGILQGTCAGRV